MELQLESLFKRFSPLAFSICLSILKSKEEAEDVVQEIFAIKVQQKLQDGPFPNLEDWGRWISVICKNRCIDIYRRQKRFTELTPQIKEHYKPQTLAAGESEALKITLEKLSPKYREVLNLKYVMGLTWAEISQRVGLSQQGMRKRYSLAIVQLRKLFGGRNEIN